MIHHGDCLDVMAGMEPESVDAIVTDPPYGINFMGKAWDGAAIEQQARLDAAKRVIPQDGVRHRTKSAFGNEAGYAGAYDFSLKGNRAFQAWCATWAEAAYHVAKPSSYLLAFGGTRTVHRMTCALEDAGWIIRDMLVWGYASGFPKSKASLKPAWEPIVMARKPGPLRMLAIDECRIGLNGEVVSRDFSKQNATPGIANPQGDKIISEGVWENTAGRWPANIVLTDPIFDGGIEGVVGGGEAGGGYGTRGAVGSSPPEGWGMVQTGETVGYGDTGTYSRFFLIPKAARSDREPVLGGQLDLGERVFMGSGGRTFRDGEWHETHSTPRQRENSHPTVKPVDLMRHLVRLVTPTGGTVLDPFLGSGTTALAAEMEGFGWIGIEREAEYVAIAEARLNGTQRGLGLDVGAPLPPPSRASVENTTAKRASYGRKPHEGVTWGLHGHPPIEPDGAVE